MATELYTFKLTGPNPNNNSIEEKDVQVMAAIRDSAGHIIKDYYLPKTTYASAADYGAAKVDNKTIKSNDGILSVSSLPVITSAPTRDNPDYSAATDGPYALVILNSNPATKYKGYIYLISE